jgi:hypothetical protein
MAQLSRPFQIALVALALVVAVWFLALNGHSTSTNSPGSSPAASASAPSAQASKAASPSPIYHGSAPGVSGLTRAIAKAHGAVATSQQNAQQLEQKAAQASSSTAPAASTPTGGTAAASTAAQHASATTSAPTVHQGTSAAHKGAGAKRAASVSPSHGPQRAVEAELKQGKIVLLLFWNPKGADDAAVRKELRTLAAHGKNKIAVHEVLASQVASFGSITRGVQVNQTPTILIINKRDQATALTGLTDVFSIAQAISEARHS